MKISAFIKLVLLILVVSLNVSATSLFGQEKPLLVAAASLTCIPFRSIAGTRDRPYYPTRSEWKDGGRIQDYYCEQNLNRECTVDSINGIGPDSSPPTECTGRNGLQYCIGSKKTCNECINETHCVVPNIDPPYITLDKTPICKKSDYYGQKKHCLYCKNILPVTGDSGAKTIVLYFITLPSGASEEELAKDFVNGLKEPFQYLYQMGKIKVKLTSASSDLVNMDRAPWIYPADLNNYKDYFSKMMKFNKDLKNLMEDSCGAFDIGVAIHANAVGGRIRMTRAGWWSGGYQVNRYHLAVTPYSFNTFNHELSHENVFGYLNDEYSSKEAYYRSNRNTAPWDGDLNPSEEKFNNSCKYFDRLLPTGNNCLITREYESGTKGGRILISTQDSIMNAGTANHFNIVSCIKILEKFSVGSDDIGRLCYCAAPETVGPPTCPSNLTPEGYPIYEGIQQEP